MWEPPKEVLEMSSDELFLWLGGFCDGNYHHSKTYSSFVAKYCGFYLRDLSHRFGGIHLAIWYAIQQYKKENLIKSSEK